MSSMAYASLDLEARGIVLAELTICLALKGGYHIASSLPQVGVSERKG